MAQDNNSLNMATPEYSVVREVMAVVTLAFWEVFEIIIIEIPVINQTRLPSWVNLRLKRNLDIYGYDEKLYEQNKTKENEV